MYIRRRKKKDDPYTRLVFINLEFSFERHRSRTENQDSPLVPPTPGG